MENSLLIAKATFADAVNELSSIRDFIRFSVTCLRAADVHIGHGSEDPFAEATALVMQALSLQWSADAEILDAKLLRSERQAIVDLLEKRVNERTPLGYLLNLSYFCGHPFYVDERVLIPRSPIAELIENGFEDYLSQEPQRILDMCTGSGCIAIALANKFRQATVTGFDISLDALHAAHENAELNNVLIRFFHVNILKTAHWEGTFDVIVSNPPYVMNSERETIEENVLNHEPEIALFVTDEDPLIFYRHIGQFAAQHLKEDGQLFLEINQALGKETVQLLKEIGFKTVELRKDFSGKSRMIRALLTKPK